MIGLGGLLLVDVSICACILDYTNRTVKNDDEIIILMLTLTVSNGWHANRPTPPKLGKKQVLPLLLFKKLTTNGSGRYISNRFTGSVSHWSNLKLNRIASKNNSSKYEYDQIAIIIIMKEVVFIT